MLLEYNSVYSAVCRSRKKGLTSCLNRHKTLYKPHLYTQHYNWYLKQVYEEKKKKTEETKISEKKITIYKCWHKNITAILYALLEQSL